MKLLRILLFPFSALYGCITWFRNLLFDLNVLSSKKFPLGVISIGNLSVGGSGKTPHIEYLLELLQTDFKIATLSRGYGRKTTGFHYVDIKSTSSEVGDEPCQLKRKFKDGVKIAVDANRARGISTILKESDPPQAILLDDAFQHRYVSPSLNILLTPYQKLYIHDTMLPTGYLREWHSGSKRADIIIVTKTPHDFSALEKRITTEDLKLEPYQKIYFTYVKYQDFLRLGDSSNAIISKEFYFDRGYSAVLVTGIANASNLYYYLKNKFSTLDHLSFSDHHVYSGTDIEKVRKVFDNIAGTKKIIVTTEKDAIRLENSDLRELVQELPIFYIPIKVMFHNEDGKEFNDQIIKHVRDYKSDSKVHPRKS